MSNFKRHLMIALVCISAFAQISSCGRSKTSEGGDAAGEGTTSVAGLPQAEAAPDIPATAFQTDDFSAKVPKGWVERMNMFGMVMYAPEEMENCHRQATFQMLNPMEGESDKEIAATSIEDHLKQIEEVEDASTEKVMDKGITKLGENEAAFVHISIASEPGMPASVMTQYVLKKGEVTMQLLFTSSEECWEEFEPVTKFVAQSVQFR